MTNFSPDVLTDSLAGDMLRTALDNVRRDHPVHWVHLVRSDDDLVPQRVLHPMFAGSYDWHSCVHQTWLIVRLLRRRPSLDPAGHADTVLEGLLTAEHGEREAAYFDRPEAASWERPYGWAWLLVLDAELAAWHTDTGDDRPRRWGAALRPLAAVLRALWLTRVVTATLPSRVGTHRNTAFALGLVLDAARSRSDTELADACVGAARRWYAGDREHGALGPDDADFLSPVLVELDLMRRVVDPAQFVTFARALVPDLDGQRWTSLRTPTPVPEPDDPHGSHLAGLALSRAWGWRELATALPTDDPWRDLARTAAVAHAEHGLPLVFGHGYAAEHWLATFAAYLAVGALDR